MRDAEKDQAGGTGIASKAQKGLSAYDEWGGLVWLQGGAGRVGLESRLLGCGPSLSH